VLKAKMVKHLIIAALALSFSSTGFASDTVSSLPTQGPACLERNVQQQPRPHQPGKPFSWYGLWLDLGDPTQPDPERATYCVWPFKNAWVGFPVAQGQTYGLLGINDRGSVDMLLVSQHGDDNLGCSGSYDHRPPFVQMNLMCLPVAGGSSRQLTITMAIQGPVLAGFGIGAWQMSP
jgi:hypothetical protein